MVATQLLTLPSSVCSDQPSNPTSEGSFSADRKTGFLKGHVFTKRDVPLSINQYEGMRVNPSIGIQFFFKKYLSGWWFGTFLVFHILGIIIPTD